MAAAGLPVASSTILAAQALVVIGLVLFLFRLRSTFGLAPLYVCLGVFQVLQTFTSGIFVEIGPLLVSTGSTVLFAASLCAVLIVYIREDALEARKLIYALVISNVTTGFLSFGTAYQLQSGLALNIANMPPAVFADAAGMLVLGSVLLYVDALLIPVVYELMARRLRRLFPSMVATMIVVLAFDSLVFVSTFFWFEPNYGLILGSAIAGKTGFALLFCAAAALYLHVLEREPLAIVDGPGVRDLFAILTYRQRFELLSQVATRDGLTGLFNRRHFDEALQRECQRSLIGGMPLSLILADIDSFKALNDRYGHPAGDQCLRAVAVAVQSTIRGGDFPARYGGEEFVILLPSTDANGAQAVAEALRESVSRLGLRHEAVPRGCVTISLGVATTEPGAPLSAEDLVARADLALYRAKDAGRDRVEVA